MPPPGTPDKDRDALRSLCDLPSEPAPEAEFSESECEQPADEPDDAHAGVDPDTETPPDLSARCRGPVVMNTREELNIAWPELDEGTFVKHGSAANLR